MNKSDIIKRLYKDYSRKYLDKIILSALFSILVAGSTSAIAWLLDPAIKKIFIEIPRDELLKKISKRTDSMFIQKCINEVKKFNLIKLNKSLSANKLIGVQEINIYLKNNINLKQCKELIKIKTRQYAKRQNTWARGHMKNWNKVYSKDFSQLLKKTLKVVS